MFADPMARARVNPIITRESDICPINPLATNAAVATMKAPVTRRLGQHRPTYVAAMTPIRKLPRMAANRPSGQWMPPPNATPVWVVVASTEETKKPPSTTKPSASTNPTNAAMPVSMTRRSCRSAVVAGLIVNSSGGR
uniref:Uncharacterized protein n=1 Tax=Rhodococcus hoagii TaxID=43767 RepID=A0A1Z1UYK2_RHOHA|nr:hypothetical protein pVAPB1413_0796 [Prescottella equi]